MPNIKNTQTRSVLMGSVLLLSGVHTARSATVVPMNLPQLADHAAQVIVGRIATLRPYWADNPRRIETEIVFERVRYLKGALPESRHTFRLIVPGGTIGTMRLCLCCAPGFEAGQKWLLFVLPTYKTFPVVGIWQGAMRIMPDETGTERVWTATAQPVSGIDPGGFVIAATRGPQHAHQRLVGANRVRLLDRSSRNHPTPALTLDEFLVQLEPILDASRDHRLTEPAGRRIPVRPVAVPLRAAAGARSAPDALNDPTIIRGPVGRPAEVRTSPRRAAVSRGEAGL